jgi:sigma-B regulation protein RsbU (phosphoserine phosphatase)
VTDERSFPSLSELYEHAACGLLVTARNGAIGRVNDTFCRWLGYSEEELIGKRLQELLTMGGRIFHQTHWAPLLAMQGSIAEVKLDVVHKDGHSIPMMMNALARGSGSNVRHEIAAFVAEDRHAYEKELLHARKRAEELAAEQQIAQEALLAAQAELGRRRAEAEDRALFAEQMMGIVSHDLRNPLATIKMSAQLMGRGELSPAQQRALNRIDNSTSRALRLITDLLDFTQARIGQGIKVSHVPIELHRIVAESVEELSSAFPGRAIEHIAAGQGECTGDPDRLAQLIGNLVGNGMSYGAPEHPVRVRSEIGAEHFTISVHNQGSPIPAELLPHLFDPMVRGTNGSSGRGLGLGLYIVREIARAHGGEVSVVSAIETGTTFTVQITRQDRR